jgi:putative nucleotidyltransferase with HDIG domain
MVPSREDAMEMLNNMVANVNLKKHMYCVEAVMRALAKKYTTDEDKWGIAGLLHDADWEKYPDEHPKVIVRKLRDMGVDEAVCHAIASHGNNSEKYGERFEKRESLIDKALYASDEISGFVVACALVRPDKLETLEARSVVKKLKDKSFAAQVNRDEIREGAEELEVDLTEHITFVIAAVKGIRKELGL